jgi:hypothetical protein
VANHIICHQPNESFNADANTGHGFAIFLASVGALRPYGLRRRLTRALGFLQNAKRGHRSKQRVRSIASEAMPPVSRQKEIHRRVGCLSLKAASAKIQPIRNTLCRRIVAARPSAGQCTVWCRGIATAQASRSRGSSRHCLAARRFSAPSTKDECHGHIAACPSAVRAALKPKNRCKMQQIIRSKGT